MIALSLTMFAVLLYVLIKIKQGEDYGD